MYLDDLRPTQCGLREIDDIPAMVEYVRQGGTFSVPELIKHNPDDRLIQITRFEDGQHFIHDGHHRCLSIWLAGRDHLVDTEYEVTDWLYRQYSEIDFMLGYLTPHDPRQENRTADFYGFKAEVLEIANTSVERAIEFIRDNRYRFCEPRSCWHISDLAQYLPVKAEE